MTEEKKCCLNCYYITFLSEDSDAGLPKKMGAFCQHEETDGIILGESFTPSVVSDPETYVCTDYKHEAYKSLIAAMIDPIKEGMHRPPWFIKKDK